MLSLHVEQVLPYEIFPFLVLNLAPAMCGLLY